MLTFPQTSREEVAAGEGAAVAGLKQPTPGRTGTIAERRHHSRLRSESLATEYVHTAAIATSGAALSSPTVARSQEQQQLIGPPSITDVESLRRLEVPSNRGQSSSGNKAMSNDGEEEVSPLTPIPGQLKPEESLHRVQQQQHEYQVDSRGSSRQEVRTGTVQHEHRQQLQQQKGGMATSTRLHPSAAPVQSQPETSLITPNPATLRKCQSTHVYFLDHYIDLLSYLKDRQERTRDVKSKLARQQLSAEETETAWREHCAQERMTLRQRRTRTKAVQFQILTQVGQGGFGEVFLARKTDTNELCALKRMSKKHLHLQDEVQHILTERDVLTATRSEWHVRLLYSFQDEEYVYLAMEFVQGGDVRTMLTARGVLREEDAKLYFAEMVLAIDALHQQGYIHRDLKPENFLIDKTGHIKLTDFGLSKGQLAENRIAAMKTKLEEVKNSMEPAMPTLRRSGGSSVLMLPGHQHNHRYGSGMLNEMSKSTMRLGGAGGSFANLNGILHRSPSNLLWSGSTSNLVPITNNSLLHLPSSQVSQRLQVSQAPLQQQQQQKQEFKNEGIRRAFSIVGSADYMAPEILASKGYDYGVDYWSLGCILFEFLAGYSPFQAEDTRQTCVNVWHWQRVLKRPVYDTEENLEFNLTDEAWDLITK
ncbi:hypothetical protein BGZ94_008066 [Podila epigama]|nr:hypothetical protein BGZ94_008066 [Podila epigama]